MENVIVVDENDEMIGTMPKDEAHEKNVLHRIAVVYVENEKGEILVQVRSGGLLDHSAAGHVDPGESYEDAARRELAEELGIKDVPLHKVGHGQTHNETYEHIPNPRSHVFDIFACTASPVALQADEVSGTYWAKPEDVLADMEKFPGREKYCVGFRNSLQEYLKTKSQA